MPVQTRFSSKQTAHPAGDDGPPPAIDGGERDDRELAALIRHSTSLDPSLRRQWLRVLSYLGLRERLRLREALESRGEL